MNHSLSAVALATGRDGTWWTHDLDPVLIQFTDTLALRWYGLAYLAGAVFAWLMMRRFAKQGRLPLPPSRVEEFVLYGAFLWMFVGGRVGYCLLYARDRLFEDPLYLFRIYEGGMASHGGIMGLAIGVFVWSRRHHVSPLVMYDAVAATAPIGVFFGRIANFINGELWGRPTDKPWGVIFPDASAWADAGVATARHPSQLYAAGLEGLLVFLVAFSVHRVSRRPGLTVGAALVTYSVVRVIDEFFREPDTGYDLFLGWMSKGQAYSIPVLVLGLWFVQRALRNPADEAAFRYVEPAEAKTGGRRK